MMQTASISSLPFATGTSTVAAALQTSALRRVGAAPAGREVGGVAAEPLICNGWGIRRQVMLKLR